MLELVADKAPDATASRVGYHVALGFGQAMNLVNASEVASPNVRALRSCPPSTITNFDQYLKEGYLEYLAPVGKGLQINVGKFVTPAGAEVIETKDNWNYSRGLLFSWAIPYFHFGMSGKYAFNSKFALTGYLVNGWNNSVDNNSGKTTGFSAAWTPNSKFSLIENYLVGPEQANDNGNFRHLTDTVVTYTPNAKLSLMANYDYGHDACLVPGLPRLGGMVERHCRIHQVCPQCQLGNRHSRRMVQGPQRVLNRTAQNVGEFTLTLQRMLASKIMTRLEFRRDMSDQDVFPYRTGSVQGCAEHSDPWHGVRVQQCGCQVGHQRRHDLKTTQLLPGVRSICWTDEERFLPSGSDAAVMWANGLGSTQTTPSTSTQAAPAPSVDCRHTS